MTWAVFRAACFAIVATLTLNEYLVPPGLPRRAGLRSDLARLPVSNTVDSSTSSPTAHMRILQVVPRKGNPMARPILDARNPGRAVIVVALVALLGLVGWRRPVPGS